MKHEIRGTAFANAERKAADRLAALNEELLPIQAELVRCRARLNDARHDLELGGDEPLRSALRADIAELTRQIDALEKQEAKLRAEAQTTNAELAKLRSQAAEEQELQRIRSIPAARTQYLQAAADVEDLARQLGEALRNQVAKAKDLAWAVGLESSHGPLSADGVMARHFVLYRHLGLVPPSPEGGVSDLRFLTKAPLPGRQKDVAAGLAALEKATIAEIATLYGSRRDAELARDEIDPSRQNVHVSQDPRSQLWTLRHGQRRYELRRPLSDYQQSEGDAP